MVCIRRRPAMDGCGLAGRSCTSAGFSALELLVVLLIIAIVIAILLPAVTSVRRSAKVAACAANLRQIGQAIREYQVDQNRRPAARLMPPPFAPFAPGLPIYDVLARYIPAVSPVYKCPADEGQACGQCVAASPARRGTSYIYVSIWPTTTRGREHAMWDYNGLTPEEHRRFRLFHRNGWNTLAIDGSVQFFLDNR